MLLRIRANTRTVRGRCATRVAFLVTVCLSLPINACMIWPGLTAAAAIRPDEGPSNLPLLLVLLTGGSGDGTGSGEPAASPPCLAQGFCWIFVTVSNWPVSGGVSVADSHCQTERASNFPTLPSSAYKAMLMTEDGTRDPSHNWVLYPGTQYRTASNSNAAVGTTNPAATFDFNLASAMASGGIGAWTGSNASWGPDTGYTCSNWQSNLGTVFGSLGNPTVTTSTAIRIGNPSCSNAYRLYCVQQ